MRNPIANRETEIALEELKNYFNNASDEQLRHFQESTLQEVKSIDAWIGIASSLNLKELTNIPSEKITLRQKTLKPIHDARMKKRWVICIWPTHSLAQEAEMSLAEFEDVVYNACLVDWKEMDEQLEKLRKVLEKGTEMRIVTDDSDVTFSYKDRLWIKDSGEHNMPGGEIFTAPIEDTVEGKIKFTFPAISAGKEIVEPELTFKKGKIVETGSHQELIKNKDGEYYKFYEYQIGLH